MLEWLREALTKRRVSSVGPDRRVRYREEPPSEKFLLSVVLMIVFFAGLVALEVAHMVVFGRWNDAVFNGVMLIVGTLLGALFGYREA